MAVVNLHVTAHYDRNPSTIEPPTMRAKESVDVDSRVSEEFHVAAGVLSGTRESQPPVVVVVIDVVVVVAEGRHPAGSGSQEAALHQLASNLRVLSVLTSGPEQIMQ